MNYELKSCDGLKKSKLEMKKIPHYIMVHNTSRTIIRYFREYKDGLIFRLCWSPAYKQPAYPCIIQDIQLET